MRNSKKAKIKKICIGFLLSFALVVFIGSGSGQTHRKKEKPKVSNSLNAESGIYEPPCCSGTGYEPAGTVLPEVSLNRPSAGNSVIDSTFGTTIRALPDRARNTYSQLQVWSFDNRYMITVHPEEGYQVRDAGTFSVIHQLSHSSPRWIPGTHQVITVDNEPGRIFVYDTDTGVEDVLMEFSEFPYISSPRSFEELSRDGRWMSLYVTNDGDGHIRLITVNLFEKRMGMNRRLQDMCAPDPQWGLLEPDWIGVSPLGNYAVIQWKRDGNSLCKGLELYDIETGDFIRRVHTHHSHSDLGLGDDGREILVSTELAHPDNNNYPAVVVYWLDGSSKEYIRMVPWFRTDHLSCQGPPGLCLITAGNEEGNPLLKGELYIMYLDGSLRRIAHHRSNSCGYWAQPKATISPDGTRIAFSSDWRDNCSQDSGFVIHNLNLTGSSTSQIDVNRSQLFFGSDTTGTNTSGQQVFFIDNSGESSLNWTLSVNASWLTCNPVSGTDAGEVSVSVNPPGLEVGTYHGSITISAPQAVNSPQTVRVTLNIYQPGQDALPFGLFETPVQGSTVRSSIPVTGWALDDIGIDSVKIYREAVPGESIDSSTGMVYVGDALFVEGARPDVEQGYPEYPFNYKAGWGYMMLTNFLPNKGNGTFVLHAIAEDHSGHRVTLGTGAIICDNANAVKPFGAVDTPAQGGTAAGSGFINWGWVLTPQPNYIPTDGSTINVYVDGVYLGHPTYNVYRADIAGLFPGYANSNGAVGYFYIDTTSYENGVHTIQWTARDSAGNTDGIGSRYFTIQNARDFRSSEKKYLPFPEIADIPVNTLEPLRVKKGFNRKNSYITINADDRQVYRIEIRQLEAVEIKFFTMVFGYTAVRNRLRPLPIGSTLDSKAGIFYWQPGPGFAGYYDFVFILLDKDNRISKKSIVVKIAKF